MSEVERYLDEIFDRLAGMGAAGRRALAETEDHLRAAVADGMAKNLPREQAEHEAVVRFGRPARIVRQLRLAHWRDRLKAALSSAWLLAGLGVTAIGVAYLAAAASIAVMLQMHPEQLPTCGPNVVQVCTDTVPTMQRALVTGLAVVAGGAVVLFGRRLAMRFAGLAPASRRFPQVAAVVFAIAGVALLAEPFIASHLPGGRTFASPLAPGFFHLPAGPGPTAAVIASAVAMTAAVAATAWGVARARRPRYLR